MRRGPDGGGPDGRILRVTLEEISKKCELFLTLSILMEYFVNLYVTVSYYFPLFQQTLPKYNLPTTKYTVFFIYMHNLISFDKGK